MKTALPILVGFATAAALAGCSVGETESQALRGQIIAPECGGGYDLESSQVTLRNESNDIIGTATTGADAMRSIQAPVCLVRFTIQNVPDAKFYAVRIGSHAGPAWSKAELMAQKYSPTLTLGAAELPESGKPSAFCDFAVELRVALIGEDFDNQPEAWVEAVHASGIRLHGLAASQLVDRNDDLAHAADPVANALDTFGWNGYSTIKALNRMLAPINRGMAEASLLASCDQWENVTYS